MQYSLKHKFQLNILTRNSSYQTKEDRIQTLQLKILAEDDSCLEEDTRLLDEAFMRVYLRGSERKFPLSSHYKDCLWIKILSRPHSIILVGNQSIEDLKCLSAKIRDWSLAASAQIFCDRATRYHLDKIKYYTGMLAIDEFWNSEQEINPCFFDEDDGIPSYLIEIRNHIDHISRCHIKTTRHSWTTFIYRAIKYLGFTALILYIERSIEDYLLKTYFPYRYWITQCMFSL